MSYNSVNPVVSNFMLAGTFMIFIFVLFYCFIQGTYPVVGLITPMGSGNTWTRICVEQMTGSVVVLGIKLTFMAIERDIVGPAS